jgi:hypothetical protein
MKIVILLAQTLIPIPTETSNNHKRIKKEEDLNINLIVTLK